MTSIAITLLASLLVLSAPEVHLAAFDAPMTPGESSGTRHIALAAAANEQEAFYVRLINDETARTLESIDIDWKGALDTTLSAYRVEPDTTSPTTGTEALWPLADPVALPPRTVLDLLVSVKIAESVGPGAFSGNLRINFDTGKSEAASVRMEVFDFVLPDESSLPIVFGLDREAIGKAAGLTEALDDWALFYDALAGLRAGFAVWPQRNPPEEIFYDYRDLDLIKEHQAYAVRTAHLPAIEIGGRPGELMAGWPPPVGNAPQDPLQLLLFNLTSNLQQLGWAKPTILLPTTLPAREGWPEARQALARVGRADELTTRLLPGPLHPYFERYTDLWALPGATPPTAMSLLHRGLSTVRYRHPAYSNIAGSPGSLDDSGAFCTEPGDALDGCEYTAWRVDTEANAGPAILEVSFDPPIRLENVAVIWPYGAAHVEILVETAYNPDSFSEATLRWTESPVLSEGECDISLGVLKHPRECRALRMQFKAGQDKIVGVAELLFNQDGRTVINASIEPVEPWLNLRTGQSPWLAPRTPGTAWRMLPWYCWQRNFRGILGPELTPETGGTRLIAAGPEGVYPSVSMLHLLDGLEDYEYLARYWKSVSEKRITPPDHIRPGGQALPISLRGEAQVRESLGQLEEDRVRMGRLLSGQALVTKNFGP